MLWERVFKYCDYIHVCRSTLLTNTTWGMGFGFSSLPVCMPPVPTKSYSLQYFHFRSCFFWFDQKDSLVNNKLHSSSEEFGRGISSSLRVNGLLQNDHWSDTTLSATWKRSHTTGKNYRKGNSRLSYPPAIKIYSLVSTRWVQTAAQAQKITTSHF